MKKVNERNNYYEAGRIATMMLPLQFILSLSKDTLVRQEFYWAILEFRIAVMSLLLSGSCHVEPNKGSSL